jgi:hypothetical protein
MPFGSGSRSGVAFARVAAGRSAGSAGRVAFGAAFVAVTERCDVVVHGGEVAVAVVVAGLDVVNTVRAGPSA